MGFWSQLRLLLWKNFTLRKRQPIRVLIEIAWPLVLFVILVAVRFRPDVRQDIPECHYEPKAMPSAGTMAFLMSYLCDFNNDCKQNLSTEEPGSINSFNDSLLVRLVDDLERLASSNGDMIVRLVRDIPLLEKFLETVVNASNNLGDTTLRLADVLSSMENLTESLARHNISLSGNAIKTMLNASLDLPKIYGLCLRVFYIWCSECFQILLEYFDFENETEAASLHSQVCNMSLDDISQLVEAIAINIDRGKLVSQVRGIFLNLTEVALSSNLDFLAAIPQLIADLTKLYNTSGFLQDLPDLIAALSSSTMGSTNGSSSNSSWISVLGKSLCGGNRTVFNADGASQLNIQNSQQIMTEGNDKRKEYEDKKEDYDFQNEKMTKVLWNQLEPVILGVINYAPETAATKRIIHEANRTFDSIGQVFALVDSLHDFLPQVQQFLETNTTAIRVMTL
ncbi:unnamed protein product, partial [Candidula unifasciata]